MKTHYQGKMRIGKNKLTGKQTVSIRTFCGFFITNNYPRKTTVQWGRVTCLTCQNLKLDAALKGNDD